MKALVGAFNQEKALVGAFSVIAQPVVEPMDRFAALVQCPPQPAQWQNLPFPAVAGGTTLDCPARRDFRNLSFPSEFSNLDILILTIFGEGTLLLPIPC